MAMPRPIKDSTILQRQLTRVLPARLHRFSMRGCALILRERGGPVRTASS